MIILLTLILNLLYVYIGDSLAYQAGHKFSAHDLDNDNWPEGSCAQAHHGAWWYHACEQRFDNFTKHSTSKIVHNIFIVLLNLYF